MKNLFRKILLGFVFLLILPGCYAEDINPPVKTSTVTATPTTGNSDILLFEDFSDTKHGWWIGKDEDSEAYYLNGKYHVIVYRSDYGSCTYAGNNYTNAIINVDVLPISGGSDAVAGIIFRYDSEDNGYIMFITNNGSFSVGKYVDNHINLILSPLVSEHIKTSNNKNKITISMNKSSLDFFINDNFVGSVQDSSYTSGDIGLCVFPSNTSDAEFAFDNLTVYKYDPLSIHIPNIPDSTPTPYYRSITWVELADFIARDHTNWNQYDSNNYVCLDYAIDLVENAKKENIKAWIVGVDFTNGEPGHAFVAFETSDKGIRYVEPQRDYTYSNLTVGNPLCDDWGQDPCMGIVKSIENYRHCDHDHYCIEYEP